MPAPTMKYWNMPPTIIPGVGNPVRNNGGTVFFAGGNSALQNTRVITNSIGWPNVAVRSGKSDANPQLISDENIGTFKPLAGGTFGAMVADKYVIMTFCSQLAGVANTTLQSPGSTNRKSQNVNIGWVNTKQLIITGGWYYSNGQPVSPLNSRDNIKTETYPGTYAIPGRLTFLSTGKLAGTQSYAARQD